MPLGNHKNQRVLKKSSGIALVLKTASDLKQKRYFSC